MIGPQQFRFIVKKGPNPGHIYPVFAEKVTIGRDPMSDIIFRDPEVSRRHVQFIRDSGSYLVEDLGSTNGTFVDGKRLAGHQVRLQAGQEIALGGAITLIFEEEGSELDLGEFRTLSSNHPADEQAMNLDAANQDAPFAEYGPDAGEEGLDESDEDEKRPQVDQLQSLPSLRQRASSSTQWPRSLKGPLENTPSSSGNVKTFTNQQIIYLVVGTAVATVIACGILFLIFSLITNNPLFN